MRKKKRRPIPIPELEEIEQEIERLQNRKNWRNALQSTVYTLIVVAAIAVLVAMLYMPVLRVSGTSMEPNLNDGDIIVGVKSGEFSTGQVCSFYYNNRLLLKRVIANAGDMVEIDADGYEGARQSEPYGGLYRPKIRKAAGARKGRGSSQRRFPLEMQMRLW